MGRALSTRSCTGRPTSARCPREIPTSHTARRRAEASFNVCSLLIVHRRFIHAIQAFHAVLMRERAFTLANDPQPASAVQHFRITDLRARKSVATPLRLRARPVWQS
jgi:hypothetical protein